MPFAGLLALTALAAGVLAGLAVPIPPFVPAVAAGAALIGALALWRQQFGIAVLACLAIGFGACGAAIGGAARATALHSVLRDVLDAAFGGFALEAPGPGATHDPVPTRFELVEDAGSDDDVVILRAKAHAVLLGGAWTDAGGEGVRITVAGADAFERHTAWTAGRTFEAPVVFRRPARYVDDGVPDFERELAFDGTTLFGSVKSGLLVEPRGMGSRPAEMAAAVRAHVRDTVTRFVPSPDGVAQAIVIAVLIGDRAGLPADTRERLQAAGTYHVIAISGGNIAIFTGLVLAGASLVGVRGRAAAVLAMPVLAAYALLVVAGPSVWRATLMAMLYLVARAADHRASPWHAWTVAAALMLCVRPVDVLDPGFLLTFGATGALLAVANRLPALFEPIGSQGPARPASRRRVLASVLRWLLGSVIASAAVELVLTPVSAQAFSRVTFAGIVLNLLAVPLMAIVQVAGTVLATAAACEPLARAAGWIAGTSADALVGCARLLDVLPILARRVPPPGPVLIAIYYAGLALALVPRTVCRRAGAVVLGVAWLGIATGVSTSWRHPEPLVAGPALRLTIFDVGQAEAMLLEAPGAGPLLVDAAGTAFGDGDDVARRVLEPGLWARGIRSVEALLVTHGDPDHVGGAGRIVADFGPRRLWTGVPVPSHRPLRDLRRAAMRAGVDHEELRERRTIAWGAGRIRVLHPPEPDWERPSVRNDDSIVIEVTYGDAAILLTGDISADIERRIVSSLTPARLRILKVAHHGSRTSTSRELLEGWRPDIAVISCGRGNRFGHPTTEVLARLEASGARVYRTDQDGQITIETNGREVVVNTRRREGDVVVYDGTTR